MSDPLDALENRIAELRQAIRGALAAHEQERVGDLRAELRRAERSWDALVTPPDREEGREGLASLLPVREQVHQALTLLGTPAAPKLISAVHEAFFAGQLPASRLASLRRDEERSYRASPGARPYYLCPALTSDLLSAARALLCVSTWPLETRISGPLSPRVDFLTSAIRIAEAAPTLGGYTGGPSNSSVQRLLLRFAVNIPGARPADLSGELSPETVAQAAKAELDVHLARDQNDRAQSARRARRQLSDTDQLFGARLDTVTGTGTSRR